MKRYSLFATAAVILLVTACSDDDEQLRQQALEDRRLIDQMTRERNSLRVELAACKESTALSSDKVLLERARAAIAEHQWSPAKRDLDTFERLHPASPLREKAREYQGLVRRALAVAAAAQAASEAVSQLDSVTVQEIYANSKRYKGKELERVLSCSEPEEAFAALFRYQMQCWVSGSMSQDVRVGMSKAQLKEFAAVPRGSLRAVARLRVKVLGREPTGSGIVVKYVKLISASERE